MLKENLTHVQNEITAAAEKAGRDPQEVTLVAVSKTKPAAMLQEVYDLGVRDFGENKVQELVDKYDQLPSDIRWHMIGHLQTNKVKYIIDKVALIHSVDSLKLAQTIDKEARKHDLTMDILLEVNVAKEESKFGIFPEQLPEFYKSVAQLANVRVRGLMTIAPFVDNAEENRSVFRQLRKLLVDINEQNVDNDYVSILSMGMTGDYQVAVEEGAAMVRVGTGIFGERSYT